jgi:hypothetical protein
MWGNYVSALFIRSELGFNTPFNVNWTWFLEDEGWYNPGFFKDVNNISDISTGEIFSCLNPSTTSFSKLIYELKTKTTNDTQVDAAFSNYSDWP